MENNSVSKWQEFSNKITIEDLINNLDKLPEFQLWLVDKLNKYYKENKKILEVWCEFWLTSFKLNDNFSKYLLDFDEIAIEKSKRIFEKYSKKAFFYNQDMFNMNFDIKFDIIFNAWVLEHFDYNDRVRLLKKYSDFLNEDWVMLIAIPNHYNLFYRLAYLILNIIWKWSFPKENKIFDMKKEIIEAWLVLESRVTIDKENIYTLWWKVWKVIKYIFWNFMKEWYLTVLTIKKL